MFESLKAALSAKTTLAYFDPEKSMSIFVDGSLVGLGAVLTQDIAHKGHLGIVKTKALLHEKVWFLCMNKMVEMKVKACLPCQVVTPIHVREPLKMFVLPDNPFDKVSVDFLHQ